MSVRHAVVRVLAGYELEFASNGRRQFVGSHGSGFFVDRTGYVVTNAHVVEDARLNDAEARHMVMAHMLTTAMTESSPGVRTPRSMVELSRGVARGVRVVRRVAEVVLPSGKRLPYQIRALGAPRETDVFRDVAVLKVEVDAPAFLPLNTGGTITGSERIHGLGYPTPADGPGSAFERGEPLRLQAVSARLFADLRPIDKGLALRVSSPISEGSSGGPGFNLDGQLLGLMTFGPRCERDTRALIPISVVSGFVDRAKRAPAPAPTSARPRDAAAAAQTPTKAGHHRPQAWLVGLLLAALVPVGGWAWRYARRRR